MITNTPATKKMIKLYLAPMEGVTDFVMRDLLTSQFSRTDQPQGKPSKKDLQTTQSMDLSTAQFAQSAQSIDQCTTEFLRVTSRLHPFSVFYKNCPELLTNSRTLAGTPVFVQLLGGQAGPMAENAVRAAELGALGIDLNFGCPAKTVNRHDGGASLLKSPERIFNIVSEVRKSVPSHIPVTVKMRLGFEDTSLCSDNALAAQDGGGQRLTVHCRTKTQGYRPPAQWEWIPQLQEQLNIPVVANGDIASLEDFKKCQQITGVHEYMIGRGALSQPQIFQQIKIFSSTASPALQESTSTLRTWNELKPLLPVFFRASEKYINIHFATSRTKQWMKMLCVKNPEALDVFNQIKALKTHEFQKKLESFCANG